MDALQLSTAWDEKSTTKAQASQKVSATLNGIYIQGAQMKSGAGLEQCEVETLSWNPVPACTLSWMVVEEKVSSMNKKACNPGAIIFI